MPNKHLRISCRRTPCGEGSKTWDNWEMTVFKRYLDLGVFQARESWIRKNFGGAGGEGLKFVISEQKYLLANKPSLIPSAIMRTIFKYIGFKLGLYEKILPNKVKHNISMHKSFWKIRKQKSEA